MMMARMTFWKHQWQSRWPMARRTAAERLALGALLTLLTGIMLFAVVTTSANAMSGGAKPPPVLNVGGEFTLTGGDGAPVRLADFRGKTVMLFFGYTACPDICPTSLLTIKQVLATLGEEASQQVQVIFISIDPERDDAAQAHTYASYFHPDFIGLTGSVDEVAAVAKQFGARYRQEDMGSEAGYLIAHTDFIYIVDANGDTRGMVGSATPVPDIARLVSAIMAVE